MLDFVRNAFRGGLEVILWINLILFIIVGGVYGNMFFRDAGAIFVGVIIGLIIGLITNIVWGGFIAVILNIDDNLESLNAKSYRTGSSSSGISSGTDLSNVPAPINRNYGDTWVCKKCNESNPIQSSSCKGCGEYK